MSKIAEALVTSGLLDKSVIDMLDMMGVMDFDRGSHDPEHITIAKDSIIKLVTTLESVLAEAENKIPKETMLDLPNLKWPETVAIYSKHSKSYVEANISCVTDGVGNYFFRKEDIEEHILAPGRILETSPSKKNRLILETSPIYINDKLVCFKVYTELEEDNHVKD